MSKPTAEHLDRVLTELESWDLQSIPQDGAFWHNVLKRLRDATIKDGLEFPPHAGDLRGVTLRVTNLIDGRYHLVYEVYTHQVWVPTITKLTRHDLNALFTLVGKDDFTVAPV